MSEGAANRVLRQRPLPEKVFHHATQFDAHVQTFQELLLEGLSLDKTLEELATFLQRYTTVDDYVKKLMAGKEWSGIYGEMEEAVHSKLTVIHTLYAKLAFHFDMLLSQKHSVPAQRAIDQYIAPFHSALMVLIDELKAAYQAQEQLQAAIILPTQPEISHSREPSHVSETSPDLDDDDPQPYSVFSVGMLGRPGVQQGRPRSVQGQRRVTPPPLTAFQKRNSLPNTVANAVAVAVATRQLADTVSTSSGSIEGGEEGFVFVESEDTSSAHAPFAISSSIPKSASHDSLLKQRVPSSAQAMPPKLPPKKRGLSMHGSSSASPSVLPPPVPQKTRRSTLQVTPSVDTVLHSTSPQEVGYSRGFASESSSLPDMLQPPPRPPKPGTPMEHDGHASLTGLRPVGAVIQPDQMASLQDCLARNELPPPMPDYPPPEQFILDALNPQDHHRHGNTAGGLPGMDVLGTGARHMSIRNADDDHLPLPASNLDLEEEVIHSSSSSTSLDSLTTQMQNTLDEENPYGTLRFRFPDQRGISSPYHSDSDSDSAGSCDSRSSSPPPLPPPLDSPPPVTPPASPRPTPRRRGSLVPPPGTPPMQHRSTDTSVGCHSYFPRHPSPTTSPTHPPSRSPSLPQRRGTSHSYESVGLDSREAAPPPPPPPIPHRDHPKRTVGIPSSPLAGRRDVAVPPPVPPKAKRLSGIGEHMGIMSGLEQQEQDMDSLYGSLSHYGLAINRQVLLDSHSQPSRRTTSLYVSGAPSMVDDSGIRERTKTVTGRSLGPRPPALPPKKKRSSMQVAAMSPAQAPPAVAAAAVAIPAPIAEVVPPVPLHARTRCPSPPEDVSADPTNPASAQAPAITSMYRRMSEQIPEVNVDPLPVPTSPRHYGNAAAATAAIPEEKELDREQNVVEPPGKQAALDLVEDEENEVEDDPPLFREDVYQEFLFEENDSDVKPLRGGTVDVMVAFAASAGLNQAEDTGKRYVDVFLSTHRPFLLPSELVEKLLARREHFKDSSTASGKDSHLQTLFFLMRVIQNMRPRRPIADGEDLPAELTEDIMNRLLETVFDLLQAGELKIGCLLRSTLLKQVMLPVKVNLLEGFLAETADMKPVETTVWQALMRFSPKEVAVQITLMDDRYFHQVDSHECLYFSSKQVDCPTLTALTDHLNATATWFLTRFFDMRSQHDRDKWMLWILKLIKQLRKLRNLGSAINLYAAMTNSAVLRLHWSKKVIDRLMNNECADLCDSTGSFKYYRAQLAIAMTTPPVIPYLGGILSDLTFANSNVRYLKEDLPDPDVKYVNYAKMLRQYSILTKLRDCQTKGFSHRMDEKNLQIWNLFQCFQDHLELARLYDVSKETVPKGRQIS